MTTTPLFRAAALEARRTRSLGEIILVQPLSFGLLTGIAVTVASLIAGYFYWGTYTRHATLSGQIVPDQGVIEVHTPQYGTIIEKHVDEGDEVRRGAVLYVLSSERLNDERQATQELVAIELRNRLASLATQIERLRALQQTENQALAQTAAALRTETASLRAMRDSQTARTELADQTARRYELLQTRGFVATDQLTSRQEDALDQRSRLQSIERDFSVVSRQLTDVELQLRNQPISYQNRIAEIEQAMAVTRQELAENETRRRLTIVAPEDGTATAVLGHVGQAVDSSGALVTLIPHGAHLRADLYAPSRTIGFVQPGDRVLLRYEAYPYQRFGHQEGTVTAISRTVLPAADSSRTAAAHPGARYEPMYRITVAITSQTVAAYGKSWPLRTGMAVEGDVLQDTRRLYEWVLEPLYTLTARIR